jgi:DNA-binding transcriptional LysR family regulator
MTTISLDALRAFQVVAQEQSFTKAATLLRQDKSVLSRTVKALEASLNMVLLERSTRTVRLSDEGAALLQRIAPFLAGLQQNISSLDDRPETPSGTVVITATPDVGRALLAPLLVAFRRRFPLVRVRVVLTSDMVDLLSDNVDLALRIGRPGAGSLIARKIGELSAGFFASPAYLEKRGAIERLDELKHHEGLWPMPPREHRSFAPGPSSVAPSIDCADFGLLAEMARAGGGVALLPTFLASKDLNAGLLVRVLPTSTFPAAPLYLVSKPLRPVPPRIAALRSFLLEALAAKKE